MKKRLFTVLKFLGFLGLGVFLVWWSLRHISDDKWGQFKAAFRTARYWLLIPVFFILSTSHILRAWRWKMLMEPLDHHPTLVNTFFAVMVGYMANLAVPRLGEVLRCTILAKYEKVPVQKLMGTIVAERAFDVFCLCIIFVMAFAFQYDIIGEYGTGLIKQIFGDTSGHFLYKKILLVIAIVVAIILIVRLVLVRFLHIHIISSIFRFMQGIWMGLISIRYLKQKWSFLFATLGIWAMYILGTWVGFYATVGTSGLSVKIAISALAFGSIGMIATPGGIGAYAIMLGKALELNGIPEELGLANGTLQWFAQFIIVLIVGFISLNLLPVYNRKRLAHEKARNTRQ